MTYERELEVAIAVAKASGELALAHQRRGVTPESKADLSPVTIADKESERLIVKGLSEAFPSDGLLGEEGAARESANGRRWIIDPIDGTRDFVRGTPSWGVLIGLEEGPDIVAGVVHFPVVGQTYYAARGMGAFQDGSPIRISGVTEVSQAVLAVSALNEISRLPFAGKLLGWAQPFWSVRDFGSCMNAMLVSAGRMDAWVEPAGKAWDFAPLKIIAEEAGAAFFNFDGGRSIYSGNCVVCVPALKNDLLGLVS